MLFWFTLSFGFFAWVYVVLLLLFVLGIVLVRLGVCRLDLVGVDVFLIDCLVCCVGCICLFVDLKLGLVGLDTVVW